MRVITCNLNGVRSAFQKGFWDWAVKQRADILCLQEMRALEDVIPEAMRIPQKYKAHFHLAARPGYSGVSLYSRVEPDRVVKGIEHTEFDGEGRYVQMDFGNLSVASIYFPSGSSSELRQVKKYEFLDHYGARLRKPGKKRKVILCGDFNIAHKEIDLKNWKSNQKNSGFLPEERSWMDKLFGDWGYCDAFRVVNQKPDQYTWWSNRGQAYAKNVGWRIDYQVVSQEISGAVRKASIFKDKKFSDHAPLIIDYDLKL